MTIRIRRSTSRVKNQQIAALITQSLLSPTSDDAPGATDAKPHGGWINWSNALVDPTRQVD